MGATTYDFKKVTVIVDGNIITGFMDGESISTEANTEEVTMHVGADGSVTFSESNDQTGKITLTLKQTSASATVLDKLLKNKKMFATQIVDSNNKKFKAGGNECRIQQKPNRTWGNEVTGLEYTILVADYKEE